MKRSTRRRFLAITAILSVAAAAFLSYSSVDNSLTAQDLESIPLYLQGIEPLPDAPTLADELGLISSVQRAVLSIVSGSDGIAFDQQREPRDLYDAKTGLCYDRSRVIEKTLRFLGFRTRHIAIYSTAETDSAIRSLVTPGVDSHAVTEVLTTGGWLVVDSNEPFVSVDAGGRPIAIAQMQRAAEGSVSINWERGPQTDIYDKPFVFVYGLYSRHGRFYPPYNRVPDMNYPELLQNQR